MADDQAGYQKGAGASVVTGCWQQVESFFSVCRSGDLEPEPVLEGVLTGGCFGKPPSPEPRTPS